MIEQNHWPMLHYLNLFFYRISLLLIGICLFFAGKLPAQIILNSDTDWPRTQMISGNISPDFSRSGTPDTLSISANQPFFDDFSYGGQYPDSNLWFSPITETEVPVITKHLAVDPPSRGVVSFDGNNRFGTPYNPGNAASGITDRLFSHYIDLAPYSPANQVYLSFYLQPQGRGDRPEVRDSFFVYFRTPEASPNEFRKVFAKEGSTVTDFQQYLIRLDDTDYFHTEFQILFQATGSQNGSLDQWHLDYVYLGLNRSASDTIYQDQSVIGVLQSPIAPYTALPVQHFQELENSMSSPIVSMSNLANINRSVTLSAELSDPVAFTSMLPPFSQQATVSISSLSHTEKSLSSFGDQVFDQLAALEMEVEVNASGDTQSQNNRFSEIYPIDSVLAYDDGEQDGSFGLNQPLGFGTQVNLTKPDSVSAVWISFQPTMHLNQVSGVVTFLKDKSFRLVIWNQPHPDSTLVVQLAGMKVDYGDRPNSFVRYAFNKPVSVPQTFWVGIQQVDGIGIGLGFDKTYDNDALTFYDSLGHWVNPGLSGTLMIRPEMVNTQAIPAAIKEPTELTTITQSWPNPLDGELLNVSVDETQLGKAYHLHILDLQGKRVFSSDRIRISNSVIQVPIPAPLQPGLYILQHIFETSETKPRMEKLIIR